jgi:uncharacterized membrane protein YebE (DUF533 family)
MSDESERMLGRDVFIALAAVGWADGKLDATEADGIVRSALEAGLDLEEIAEIEEATREPVRLAQLDLSAMSKADRLFVYAVASWIARLDGVVDPREQAVLAELGDALRLPARPRAHAEAIALEIGSQSESLEPSFFNLPKLRRTLQVRLAMAQQLRAAARGGAPGGDDEGEDS